MVSLTLLAAIGIGGFVAYKVIGAVAPKIQVTMPSLQFPEELKIGGFPSAEELKEIAAAPLAGVTEKIPDPGDMKAWVNDLVAGLGGYVDEKVGGSKAYVDEKFNAAAALAKDSWDKAEGLAREGIEAAKEAPGKIVDAAVDKLIVKPLAAVGEAVTWPFRQLNILPTPGEQWPAEGSVADKIIGWLGF